MGIRSWSTRAHEHTSTQLAGQPWRPGTVNSPRRTRRTPYREPLDAAAYVPNAQQDACRPLVQQARHPAHRNQPSGHRAKLKSGVRDMVEGTWEAPMGSEGRWLLLAGAAAEPFSACHSHPIAMARVTFGAFPERLGPCRCCRGVLQDGKIETDKYELHLFEFGQGRLPSMLRGGQPRSGRRPTGQLPTLTWSWTRCPLGEWPVSCME